MKEIISILIKRNGSKEHKIKGTSEEVAKSFETWVHKELGGRRVRWR